MRRTGIRRPISGELEDGRQVPYLRGSTGDRFQNHVRLKAILASKLLLYKNG